MTDSYDNTLTALLREERDANRIHKAAIDRLKVENTRLAEENAELRRQIWDQIRDETEELGTFPAMPRSELGVKGVNTTTTLTLVHFAALPLGKVYPRAQKREGDTKPQGLWLSVEGNEEGWSDWCKGEQFGLDRLAVAHRVELAPDATILWIANAAELDSFTRIYNKPIGQLPIEDRYGYRIDWWLVASRYQGIVIAPYIWERRLTLHTHWYYGWDCASGCVWDPAAIASVTVLSEPCECTPTQECDRHYLDADDQFRRVMDR